MQDDPLAVTSVANLVPSQWHRLKEILANALEQNSPERRATTLREFCANDTTLLRQAETLLAGDTDTLEQFAEFATTRLRSEEPDRIGERVGAYVIVGELGRGGMGAVYLGERADGQFEKQVAIKVLKRGTDTDEVLRRFAVERQILARLDHPNITRLLDAGTTGDGLPYVVMDYVDGVAITQFAQEQKLSLADRLRLFLKVCSAVEFAHGNGVIHRDIKPTNIVVTCNSEPKLLDFGIAKLVQPGAADDLTSTVERRITPRYAAPEQSRAEPMTLTADVYSLGLVLFELVTGTNITSETRSKAVLQTKLHHTVDPALAVIIGRATETAPEKRYASAAALRNALEQYLSGTASSKSVRLFGAGGPRVGHSWWWLLAPLVIVVALVSAVFFRSSLVGPFWSHNNSGFTQTQPKSSSAGAERLIAVLPFKPLGSKADDDVLGLGMADAVIGQMSKMKGIRVLPTSAVLKLKDETNDPLVAAAALKADAVLTGTVQRSGDRIRVSVQLFDGHSGRALWSDKFDETFTDVFAVQDSISGEITKALAIDVTADERKQLAKHSTKSIDAYNAYLMGLHFYNKRTKEGLEEAIGYFHQATQCDPEYALAYAILADCYHLQGYYKFVPMKDAINNCKPAAERALALDDSVAEAHVAMAAVQFENRDSPAGMQSLRRALALNPSLAVAHQRYAWVLCDMGNLPEAVSEMKRAQELDPMSATNNTALGVMFAFNRQFDETLRYCFRARELEPGNPAIQENLGYAYAWNGMYEPAIQAYHKVIENFPDEKGTALTSIAAILYVANRNSEADSLRPEITRMADEGKIDAYSMTILYATAGQLDQAFECFDKALAEETVTVPFLRYGPELDMLRADPRFRQLLRKHGRNKLADGLSAH
jgi:serine/threonine protein kinase/tetratricopeptide (TPR) repeat protein